MSNNENLFRLALNRVKNDQKALDKPAKAMVSQYLLDSRVEPFQEIFDDAVAERLANKGNKTQQGLVSQAWTLAAKRIYWHLGESQLRPIFPSICSGGNVEIKTVSDARRDNAAAVQKKADDLQAASERSALRSEANKIERMKNETAKSIADSLRDTLTLSGISIADIAWEITHGDSPIETWDTFMLAVTYLGMNGKAETAIQATTSLIEPSLETA